VYFAGTHFTMSGGTISGNQAWEGGGVYVNSGTFTMSEGTISSNFANTNGGGVYVGDGTFTKTGGIIHGWDPADSLRNNVGDGDGGAVYMSDGKKRNSTADVGDDLNSTLPDSDGGWE
jgi:predicted outer membrane repeat protein